MRNRIRWPLAFASASILLFFIVDWQRQWLLSRAIGSDLRAQAVVIESLKNLAEGIAVVASVVVAAVSATFAVRTFKRGVDERRQANLLEMERMFLDVWETMNKIENTDIFDRDFRRDLELALSVGDGRGSVPIEHRPRLVVTMEIDRCLRFFFVLQQRFQLNGDATKDDDKIAVSYSYYAKVVLRQPALARYVERFYPETHAFIGRLASASAGLGAR